MTSRFISSPGGSGEFARVIDTTTSRARDSFATRKDLVSGVDSMFRPRAFGDMHFRVIIRGLNATYNHAQAVNELIPGALAIIQGIAGQEAVKFARLALLGQAGFPKAFLSGNTHDSVHARMETTPGSIIMNIGPTTFYSPLIEFGLARHARHGPRPFMSYAFSETFPHWLAAIKELARVSSGPTRTIKQNPYASPTNDFLRQFRDRLYTIEKELGDLVPLGIPLSIGRGIRENLIGTARVLGDLQAVMTKAVGARFVRRMEGKVTGRLIGIGSNTIFTSRTFGARISGGERIYNRWAGKHMSRFIGQSQRFRGGF